MTPLLARRRCDAPLGGFLRGIGGFEEGKAAGERRIGDFEEGKAAGERRIGDFEEGKEAGERGIVGFEGRKVSEPWGRALFEGGKSARESGSSSFPASKRAIPRRWGLFEEWKSDELRGNGAYLVRSPNFREEGSPGRIRGGDYFTHRLGCHWA